MIAKFDKLTPDQIKRLLDFLQSPDNSVPSEVLALKKGGRIIPPMKREVIQLNQRVRLLSIKVQENPNMPMLQLLFQVEVNVCATASDQVHLDLIKICRPEEGDRKESDS